MHPRLRKVAVFVGATAVTAGLAGCGAAASKRTGSASSSTAGQQARQGQPPQGGTPPQGAAPAQAQAPAATGSAS